MKNILPNKDKIKNKVKSGVYEKYNDCNKTYTGETKGKFKIIFNELIRNLGSSI